MLLPMEVEMGAGTVAMVVVMMGATGVAMAVVTVETAVVTAADTGTMVMRVLLRQGPNPPQAQQQEKQQLPTHQQQLLQLRLQFLQGLAAPPICSRFPCLVGHSARSPWTHPLLLVLLPCSTRSAHLPCFNDKATWLLLLLPLLLLLVVGLLVLMLLHRLLLQQQVLEAVLMATQGKTGCFLVLLGFHLPSLPSLLGSLSMLLLVSTFRPCIMPLLQQPQQLRLLVSLHLGEHIAFKTPLPR